MKIIELRKRADLPSNPKLNEIYTQFNELVNELNNKNLPEKTIISVNNEIEELNSTIVFGNNFKRLILKKQSKIIRRIEKEHKIVPKNYYRNLWLVLGMTVFGFPIGVAFGASIRNMGLLAIGLPIGLAIGFAVGSSMDKKAFKEGRQLNVEIKNGI